MSLLAPVSALVPARPATDGYAASAALPRQQGFAFRHLLLPGLGLFCAYLLLAPLHGDFWWADHLYAWGGHAWAWQNGWLTETVLHRGGRAASAVAWVLLVLLWLGSCLWPAGKSWRRPLLFLVLATAATTLLVGALKRYTDMDCPWDLLRYGGTRPYVALWQSRPATLPAAACFPAGHASAGYSWVALYFFFRATRPAWRWRGLAIGLGLGLLFGLAQQWRGAHFLSHDVATLAVAWCVGVCLFRLLRLPDRVQASSASPRALPLLAQVQS